jgi:hypothetical protein
MPSASGTLRGIDVIGCSFLHTLRKNKNRKIAYPGFLPVIFIGN